MIEKLKKDYLKIPYKLHGRDFSGTDCWGLIILIYKHFLNKVLLDLNSLDFGPDWHEKSNFFIENYYKEWESVKEPRRFDIVFFKNEKGVVNHCALYTGQGYFIHTNSKNGVQFAKINSHWRDKIQGFYRLKNDNN